MTESNDEIVVTPHHAAAFGYIIHFFAKAEQNMMIAVAGMLDTDFATAMLLMGDTNYRQKRQTTRHIHHTRGIDGKVYHDLNEILDEIHRFSGLRNHIAHSIWTSGQRPGSIKPMYLVLRGDLPKPVGHFHNEKDYTLDELQSAVKSLMGLQRKFTAFLEATGLMGRVHANIDKINDPTQESPG